MLSYFHNLESFFEYMDIYCRGWEDKECKEEYIYKYQQNRKIVLLWNKGTISSSIDENKYKQNFLP